MKPIGVERETLRTQVRMVLWSVDFACGIAAFVGVLVVGIADQSLMARGVEVLLVEGGFGLALLGVILAALSIIVGPLGEEYVLVLDQMPGGVRGALRPYQVVSLVSGVSTIIALAGAAFWSVNIGLPFGEQTRRALALAASSGLFTWAVVGTIQLVNLTVLHGVARSSLIKGILEAKRRGKSA